MKLLIMLDYFFIVFHAVFTIFNATGWIFKKTRKLHLAAIMLTSFSWYILGIFYGWGYCFCTDWHWQVREALGRPPESDSYIHFLILEITGKNLPQELVNNVTLTVFITATVLTLILNIRDFIISNRHRNK